MGTVFPWVGKGSHHIKEGGWLCVNKTLLLLNILKHDLKSDLQSCCQETEEVSCLFYKLPVFSPLVSLESTVMDGRRAPCSQKSLKQRLWAGCHLCLPLAPAQGTAKHAWCQGSLMSPTSSTKPSLSCSLGRNCYTHGPLMTFISCVSDNITLLVEWQCSTGQETALAGKCQAAFWKFCRQQLCWAPHKPYRKMLCSDTSSTGQVISPGTRGTGSQQKVEKNFPSLST